MIEKIQCIVVSTNGSLGLLQDGNLFSMLHADVEFVETPAEAAHRMLRQALGHAVDFERFEQLNCLSDSEGSVQFTFVLCVKESATTVSASRGFQWLNSRYREALEARYPQLLGAGVASSYRRALASVKKFA